MLARLFRRHRPVLPSSSAELAEALRAAAPFADGDDVRAEYLAAADALDRAIAQTRAHGDEPTRDALAYALGRAELNLKDQLSELIEVSKETQMLIQGQGAAITGLRAEFHDGMQAFGERLNDVETRTDALERTVAGHSQSRDQSIQDRRLLRQDMDASKQHRAQIQARLDSELPDIKRRLADLGDAVQRIEQLLEPAGDRHEPDG